MPIPVGCPSCGTNLNARDNMVGRKTKCPKCGTTIVIPGPSREAAEFDRTMGKESTRDVPIPQSTVWREVQARQPNPQPISFSCSSCSSACIAHNSSAGQRMKCPFCGVSLTVPSINAEPLAKLVAPPQVFQGLTDAVAKYFVKDEQGSVSGAFSSAALKQMAHAGTLSPGWHVSLDRVRWTLAGKVQGIFPHLEAALTAQTRSGPEYRALTRTEMMDEFLKKFVYENEQFKDMFPWLQTVRVWWAKLTSPRRFVIAEMTGTVTKHYCYDMVNNERIEINQQEADSEVKSGASQFNWFGCFAAFLAAIWLVSTLVAFAKNFTITLPLIQAVLTGIVSFAVWIYKIKRTRVFVGYTLDETAGRRLAMIRSAFQSLRQSCKVWIYRLEANEGDLDWKYNAGSLFHVARLPAAVFDRPIPNVETNIRVSGIIDGNKAIYFLPEKVLVICGGQVQYVEYANLQIAVSHLEYPESEGHVYHDSQVVDHRWLRINRDGSQDRRFKENSQIPVVRCGIAKLNIGGTNVEMLTSNPTTPSLFKEQLETGVSSNRQARDS